MTTLRDALAAARERLRTASDSASLDAQLLLAEVLGESRAHVLAHPEKVLTSSQQHTFEQFIARREQGEPIAYLLGRRAWYDREFIVSPAVLIPRPETELLLEAALADADRRAAEPKAEPLRVVDVGTGSGALAVTFAALRPAAQVCAVDLSPAALDIARQNAALHKVTITFFEGDLLLPLIERGLKADLILANLPYIASDELPTLAVSRHEPHLALDGGGDGLALVRRLLREAPQVAARRAVLLLEIGAGQGPAALQAARDCLALPHTAAVSPDYAGHDRIVRIALD